MMKAYKTEILPTKAQRGKIVQSLGVCRWIYNQYVAKNKKLYKMYLRGLLDAKQKHFMTANDFDKYINHRIKTKPDMAWIDSCGAKARKKAMVNAQTAFRKYFKGKAGSPNFKKRRQQNVKLYFPKNNKGDWTVKRHWVQVPTIGRVRLKEFGYLPVGAVVTNGTVSQKADRFYVSVVVDIPDRAVAKAQKHACGIDLGLKHFATVSDGTKFRNINRTAAVRKQEKKLRREQRCLSRKLEAKKKRGVKTAAYSANISKNVLRIQKLHRRLDFIRTDYVNKVINEIIRREPSHVTIEDLNVSGMMKNRHLAKAIAGCKFSEFRVKLTAKCHEYGIELRVVDRFYPSSKTCHNCGNINRNLKLSDRVYKCPICGNVVDRDLQAALNLRDATEYMVA